MIKKGNEPVLFFYVSCELQVWGIDNFSDHY
jgi:hypothetical protein